MSSASLWDELEELAKRLIDVRLDLELVRIALKPSEPLLMPTERGEGEAGTALLEQAIHKVESAIDDLGGLQDILKK